MNLQLNKFKIYLHWNRFGATSGHCAVLYYISFVFWEWIKKAFGHVAKPRDCVSASWFLFIFPSPYSFSSASIWRCYLPAKSVPLTKSNYKVSSSRALWHATSILNTQLANFLIIINSSRCHTSFDTSTCAHFGLRQSPILRSCLCNQ